MRRVASTPGKKRAKLLRERAPAPPSSVERRQVLVVNGWHDDVAMVEQRRRA